MVGLQRLFDPFTGHPFSLGARAGVVDLGLQADELRLEAGPRSGLAGVEGQMQAEGDADREQQLRGVADCREPDHRVISRSSHRGRSGEAFST